MSRLCLSLTGSTGNVNVATLQKYREYIDLCELRVDFLRHRDQESIAQFPAQVKEVLGYTLPIILTCRHSVDGGNYTQDDDTRLALMHQVLSLAHKGSFDYIDIEYQQKPQYNELLDYARHNSLTVIRSIHHLHGGLDSFLPELLALSQDPLVIPKIAVTPSGMADVVLLLKQWKQYTTMFPGRRAIFVAMGAFGLLTRVLAPKLGSYISYCSALGDAAPGHLDPLTMTEHQFKTIDSNTKIFAIIGNPLGHTRSPHFHNKIFRTQKLNACYVPILVDHLPSFFELAQLLSIQGVSVTVPYKRKVLQWVDATPPVAEIGACNTLLYRNGWHGYNTDCVGVWQPLAQLLSQLGLSLPKRALIIGAGGVARAAAYVLLTKGVELLILNRTLKRAQQIVADFSKYPCAAAALDSPPTMIAAYSHLIVQSTSVGMHPKTAEDPLPTYHFSGKEIVYDLIYNPKETAFLKRAKQKGAVTLGGEGMFIAQAHQQSAYFCQALGS